MTSIVFKTDGGDIGQSGLGLRQELSGFLDQAKHINVSDMIDLATGHGKFWTMAAGHWAKHDSNDDQKHIFLWRGSRVSQELYEELVQDNLEMLGCYRAARFPLSHEYIGVEHLAYASGSHLYDLQDNSSDWDAVVLVDKEIPIRTDDTEPYFRLFTPSALLLHASHGNRHAWEFLMAPEKTRMAWSDRLESVRQQALEVLLKRPIDWRKGSQAYFNLWYRHFFVNPKQEPDPSIARWKKSKGWPYKLGYYIYIDLYLSQRAQNDGHYTLRIDDQEIRALLHRMKQGNMRLQEWMDLIAPMVPEGCDLVNHKGEKPKEFLEVQT